MPPAFRGGDPQSRQRLPVEYRSGRVISRAVAGHARASDWSADGDRHRLPAVQDARDDFLRARRRAALSAVRRRLHGRSATYDVLLPFDEVVAALGRRGERDLGEQVIESTRWSARWTAAPASTGCSGRPRTRWSGGSRASTWRCAGARRCRRSTSTGSATCTSSSTATTGSRWPGRWAGPRSTRTWSRCSPRSAPDRDLRLEDLPTKGHERVFAERVPLPPRMRARVELHRGRGLRQLAEMVEAWSFRYMQQRGRMIDRREAAETWFTEEYEPAVELLRRTGLLADGTETEGYLRLSCERYRLLRSHSWDDDDARGRLLGARDRLPTAPLSRAPLAESRRRCGSDEQRPGPGRGRRARRRRPRRVDPGQHAPASTARVLLRPPGPAPRCRSRSRSRPQLGRRSARSPARQREAARPARPGPGAPGRPARRARPTRPAPGPGRRPGPGGRSSGTSTIGSRSDPSTIGRAARSAGAPTRGDVQAGRPLVHLLRAGRPAPAGRAGAPRPGRRAASPRPGRG